MTELPLPPRGEAVLDTSAWLAIFNDEPEAASLGTVADLRLVTTPIVLAEVAAHGRLGRVVRSDPATEVERRARLEGLTREDALAAAEVYARLRKRARAKVSLADVLIYATAQRIGATLVTLNGDLVREPGVWAPPGVGRQR